MGIEGLGAHGRCRLPEDRGCSQNGSPEDSRKEKFYPAGTLLSEPLSNCEGRRRLVVWVTKWSYASCLSGFMLSLKTI
jgi:hypothetical protein